jgi:hypothetical protein
VQGNLKIVWLLEDGSDVKQGDLVVRFDESGFAEELRQGEEQRARVLANMARERAYGKLAVRNRERTASLAGESKELAARFRLEDNEVFSRNQIIESAIEQDLNAARLSHANDAKDIQERLSGNKLGLLSVDRKKADLDIEKAKESLASLDVLAPHDGIFVLERNDSGYGVQVGDMVWNRQTIGEVSRVERLEALVYVLEADASGLEAGRAAKVMLEADLEHSSSATVKRVASLAKRRRANVPAQYFEALLELEGGKLAADMKPGKRVIAELTLGEEEGVVVPRQAVFEKDDRAIVHRLTETGFETVPVEVGSSTPGRLLVRSGLRVGDVVALSDPEAPKKQPSGSGPSASSSPSTPGAGAGRGPAGPRESGKRP